MTLLSLAAAAAGKTIGWGREGPVEYRDRGGQVAWNPLLNDGDNFRLQVQLRMRLVIHDTCAECYPYPSDELVQVEPVTTTLEAAARRAVCRAAAVRAQRVCSTK